MKKYIILILLAVTVVFVCHAQNPVQVSQPQWFLKYIKQGPYTTATLPVASTCAGCIVYNSDSLQFQFSNGIIWRSIAGTNMAGGGGVDTIYQHADSLLYRVAGRVRYGGKWLTFVDTANGIASSFALADSVAARVRYTDSGTIYLTPYRAAQLFYPLSSNPAGYYKPTDTAFTLATQATARRIADSVGALKVNISDTAAMGARNTLAYVVNNGNRAYKSLLVGNSIFGADTLTFNGTGPVNIATSQNFNITANNFNIYDYATYFNGAGGVHTDNAFFSPYSAGYVFDGGEGVTYLNSAYPGAGMTNILTLPATTDTIATKTNVTNATVNLVSKIIVDTIIAQKYINPVLNYTADNQSLTAVTITPTIQLNGHTGNSYVSLQVNGPTQISTNLTVGTATSSPIVQAITKVITTNVQPYINGSIKAGTIGSGGTGYGANVTYTNVAVSSTGGGAAIFPGITSNASGVITTVTYSPPAGTGFSIGDTVRPVSSLGSGTGFYYLVTDAQNGLYLNAQNGTNRWHMYDNGHLVSGTALDTAGVTFNNPTGVSRVNRLSIINPQTGTAANGLYLDASGNVIMGSTPISLTSLSASSPLSYNNTTGVFSIQQANTSQAGYLSITDWNTFNGKQAAGSYINNVSTTGVQQYPGAISISGGAKIGLNANVVYDSSNTRFYVTKTGTAQTSAYLNAIIDSSNQGPDVTKQLNTSGYSSKDFKSNTDSVMISIGYPNLSASIFPGLPNINVQSNKPLVFGFSSVEKFRLTNNGYIGILTSSPTNAITINDSALGANGGIVENYRTGTNSSYYRQLFNNTTGNYNMWVNPSGSAVIPSIKIGVPNAAGATTMESASRLIAINNSTSYFNGNTGSATSSLIDFSSANTGITNVAGVQFRPTSSSAMQTGFGSYIFNAQSSTAGYRAFEAVSNDSISGSGGNYLFWGGTVSSSSNPMTGSKTLQWAVDSKGHEFSPATITAIGTTGNQTINKPNGTINIAAAGTSVVLTNNLITTSSMIFCTIQTNDATAKSVQAVPGSGTCTIYLNAAATGTVAIAFWVKN